VLEAAHIGWPDLRYAPAVFGQWERLAEGWEYLQLLRAAHVPVRRGWSVVAAHDTEQVEAATVARLDEGWQPVSGTEQRIAVDAVVIGYGFVPATELSRLAGCEHVYGPDQGGWVPVRDDDMRTTQPGLYVVGDAGGIRGAVAARLEGRIAAYSVARDVLGTGKAERGLEGARRQLARERRFARMTATLFTPGSGLDALATDETIICRCEGVTLGQIKAAVRDGARTAGEVKGVTCAGMGNCQARICGTVLPRLVARELASLGLPHLAAPECLTVRPPIHPLPLPALAGSALAVSRRAEPPAAVRPPLPS
jgi:NAD(P)H-nitrite reductase large subunit